MANGFKVIALTVAVLSASYAFDAHHASAQTPAGDVQQIEATPKGTVGLGIVGAEIGFLIPALAGMDQAWAYVLFPILGGTAGALGGYFGFDQNDQTEVSVISLAFGMAMIVPTMVATLALTAYDPDDEAGAVPAEGGGGGPPAPEGDVSGDVNVESGDGGVKGGGNLGGTIGSNRLQRLRRQAMAGPGLVRHGDEGWFLAVPGVGIVPEQADGLTASLHVPVVTGSF